MKLDANADKYFKGILEKTGDDTYQVPRLDPITHASMMIDYEHHEIHNGTSFTAYYTRTTAATDAHRSAIYLLTPTSPELHMIISFAGSAASFFTICEGVTIDLNEGTNGVEIINRDRNSNKISGAMDNATAHTTNKVTTFDETELAAANFTAGTIIRTEPIAIGTGPKPAGGDFRGAQEYILMRNTPYVFLLTNLGANANVHHIFIDWYEHTPKGE